MRTLISAADSDASDDGYVAFISYPSRYQDWVAVLHGHLEQCLAQAGRPARIFLDQLDLAAGYSWLSRLQTGVGTAAKLILVVTPEALASPWVEAEYQGFVSTNPDWAHGRVLVVCLVETPLPPFLQTVQLTHAALRASGPISVTSARHRYLGPDLVANACEEP